MLKALFFVLRISAAWMLVVLLASSIWYELPLLGRLEWPVAIAGMLTMALVVAGAFSHLRRVRLIAGRVDSDALANRQRRQIEIPFEAGEAFDLVDAAIRELPRIEQVESARDSLQVRAKVGAPATLRRTAAAAAGTRCCGSACTRNQILATVTPGDDTGSVTLICEPESPALERLVPGRRRHQPRERRGDHARDHPPRRRAPPRRAGRRARRPRPRRNSPSPSSACCTRRSSRTSSTTRWPARSC